MAVLIYIFWLWVNIRDTNHRAIFHQLKARWKSLIIIINNIKLYTCIIKKNSNSNFFKLPDTISSIALGGQTFPISKFPGQHPWIRHSIKSSLKQPYL